jgi:cytidylate kinase
MIVTIDGPAGTGKSTAAKRLADRLGFEYLDTGAMYRGIAARCLQDGVDPGDEAAVSALVSALAFDLTNGRVAVGGLDVTDLLRTPETTRAASIVAQNVHVRAALVEQQRRLAADRDIVCEGRDQGTVAFPQAECKFYLFAAPEVRAQRRQQELAAQGRDMSLDELLAEQSVRDERDANRAVAPLRPAADAVLIDTSQLDLPAVVAELESLVRIRRARV